MQRYEDSPANLLAKRVAVEFGGKHVPCNHDGEYFEGFAKVEVPAQGDRLGYELTLSMRGYGAKKDTVTVSLYPLTVHSDIAARDFPQASMNATRGEDALCADIRRRVVNSPTVQPKLREYESKIAAREKRTNDLKRWTRDFCAATGATTSSNFRSDGLSNTLFSRPGAVSWNGRIYADGSFSFDRIGSVSNDQARRIAAILAETENG